MGSGERFPSLDGLRGLAALVVLVYHGVLVSPAGADVVRTGVADGWAWWFTYTPAHLLWAGSEAVVVFFVLSGFVLALPFLDAARRPTWWSYYPARLVRLYVPVAASLALAVLTFAVVDHRARPGMSWWIAGHDLAPDVGSVAWDLFLLGGPSWLNSPLWSLQWEVVFSLVLPLALLVATRAGRARPAVAVAGVAAVAAVGVLGIGPARYVVMFGLGVLMAAERSRLAALFTRVNRVGWQALTTAAATLLIAGWWPVVGPSSISPALVTVGAMLLVAVFLWSPAAVALGNAWPVQWLGKRSFSLYLVHEPVIVTTALLLHTDNSAVVLTAAIPVVLVVTTAFYVVIERPSQLAAKRSGRLAAQKWAANTTK